MKNEPELLPNGAWTCPDGYKFLKCPGCGHNFYEYRPVKGDNNGGLCHWCIMEQDADQ